MKKTPMIETPHLILRALSCEELKLYVESTADLARVLNLGAVPREPEPVVLDAIAKDLLPNLNDPMKEPMYHTLWVVIDKTQRKIVAGFCFHGSPDEHGEIEVGYGTEPEFQNQGIMSETLRGLIGWLKESTPVKILKAETENENLPSLKLLEKTGFTRWNDQGSLSIWRLML